MTIGKFFLGTLLLVTCFWTINHLTKDFETTVIVMLSMIISYCIQIITKK